MFPDEQVDERDDEAAPEAGLNPLARMVLWLVIFSLALMFLPLYLASVSLKEMRPTLEAQLSEIAVTLNTTPEPNATTQAMNDRLLSVRGQVLVLDSLQSTLTYGYRDWSILMRYIGTFNADQMIMSGVTQSAETITLNGRANDEAVVMAYVQHLRENSQFDTVTIQSITADTAPPTPTPDSTEEPGSTSSSETDSMQAVKFILLVKLAPPGSLITPTASSSAETTEAAATSEIQPAPSDTPVQP